MLVADHSASSSRTLPHLTTYAARRTKNNPVLIGEPGVGKTGKLSVERLPRDCHPHVSYYNNRII